MVHSAQANGLTHILRIIHRYTTSVLIQHVCQEKQWLHHISARESPRPRQLRHMLAHDRCHEPRFFMMSWEHTWTHSNIFSETALPSPLSLAVPLHHHFFYGNDLTICFSATKVLQFSEKTACNTSKKTNLYINNIHF